MKLKDMLAKMFDNYRFVVVVDDKGEEYSINPHSYHDIPDSVMEKVVYGWGLFYDRLSIVVQ